MITRPPGASNAPWLLSTIRAEDWRSRAACAGATEPLWDATIDGETPEDRTARHTQAKAICERQCTVGAECLAAFQRGVDEGIRAARELPPILPPAKSHARTEIAHGTERGAQQHRRRGEPVCQSCAQAAARAHVDRVRRREEIEANRLARSAPIPCGTLAANKRHYLAGETCDVCREARNAREREQRAARKRQREAS